MHRTRPSLALVILALALSGCGDAGAPVRERDGAFTVTLDDYLIRPQEIRVPKGRRLTVTVVNQGRLGHTFRIRSVNRNVLRIHTIQPGRADVARASGSPPATTRCSARSPTTRSSACTAR